MGINMYMNLQLINFNNHACLKICMHQKTNFFFGLLIWEIKVGKNKNEGCHEIECNLH